jgi:hypothetical protein
LRRLFEQKKIRVVALSAHITTLKVNARIYEKKWWASRLKAFKNEILKPNFIKKQNKKI